MRAAREKTVPNSAKRVVYDCRARRAGRCLDAGDKRPCQCVKPFDSIAMTSPRRVRYAKQTVRPRALPCGAPFRGQRIEDVRVTKLQIKRQRAQK